MNTLKTIYRWYDKAEKAVCGGGLIGLVILILLSAIFRAFKMSMSWNNDLALLLLAWTAFLGADVAWRSGQIIGVDLLTRKLPLFVRRIIELIILVIILGALFIMVIFGTRLAWSDRIEVIQSLHIPYSLVTVSLIVASFSMIFTTIIKVKNAVLKIMGKDTAMAEENTSPSDDAGNNGEI
ncbi:MAG: TRAP transporter small permease subunit [Spirochaetales bacterium]|nr:TRAP transporter small permease subunit [Spirochaetales bacterium]